MKTETPESVRPGIWFVLICLLGGLVWLALIRTDHPKVTTPESTQQIAAQDFRAGEEVSPHWRYASGLGRSRQMDTRPAAAEKSEPQAETNSSSSAILNELIVKLKPGMTNIDELAAALNAKVAGRLDKYGAYRLQFADMNAAAAARSELASNAEVDSLDSNYAVKLPPAGEEVAAQSNSKINVKPGDSGGQTIVGLVDTAVSVDGSGLDKSFFLPGVSVAGESSAATDTPSHGTSMAEAILQGVSAIEPGKSESNVKILSVDVYGNSETTSTYQVAEGIAKAVEQGSTYINLSLGADSGSSVLQQVIQDSHNQGIVLLGAAGNEPVTTATYPAAYSEVVAVTATDSQGQVASYANHGDFVDVATPGSTVVGYNGKSYQVTGTSTSTALATGAAAGYAEKTGDSTSNVEQAVRQGLKVK